MDGTLLNNSRSPQMSAVDPFSASAGPQLDRIVHHEILNRSESDPPFAYASEACAARAVERASRAAGTARIVGGRSKGKGRLWFARYEDDPITAEVWADTYPSAICPLALLCR